MTLQQLQADTRTFLGRKTFFLRQEGKIPAVVYGAGLKKPKNISLNRNAFIRVFKAAGESSLVELAIDGKEALNVLIQDIQLDPLRDEVTHADFRAVDMKKPIEADVKLIFVGESEAVKNLGGILVKSKPTLAIRALPKDLVSSIEVDLSLLKTFDDAVHVKDLKVPAKIEVIDHADVTVAVVTPPRSEEELASLETAVEVDVTKVEVEKKGKEEEEEGKEGEAEKAAAPTAEKAAAPAANKKEEKK